jgi:hypothetical protein
MKCVEQIASSLQLTGERVRVPPERDRRGPGGYSGVLWPMIWEATFGDTPRAVDALCAELERLS